MKLFIKQFFADIAIRLLLIFIGLYISLVGFIAPKLCVNTLRRAGVPFNEWK